MWIENHAFKTITKCKRIAQNEVLMFGAMTLVCVDLRTTFIGNCRTTAFGIYRVRERRENAAQVTTCSESIFANGPTFDGARWAGRDGYRGHRAHLHALYYSERLLPAMPATHASHAMLTIPPGSWMKRGENTSTLIGATIDGDELRFTARTHGPKTSVKMPYKKSLTKVSDRFLPSNR